MAVKGNSNNLKSGRYSAVHKNHRLTLGEWPKGMIRQQQNVRKYRRALEAATAERHGEISISAAHLINEAASHEAHAQAMFWLLRHRLEVMTPADMRAISRDIGQSRRDRNKAVAMLGLDAQRDPIGDWFESQQLGLLESADSPSAPESPQSAPDDSLIAEPPEPANAQQSAPCEPTARARTLNPEDRSLPDGFSDR